MTQARSLTGALWRAAPAPESDPSALPSHIGLSDIAASCLLGRISPETGEAWMNPSLDHLHDPYAMLGMEESVSRLRRATRDGERVRIITDYDVDGTTSSLLLQATLRLLKPDLPLDYHIPSRFDEGYGFSVQAANTAADDGIQLVITADIGVRDHAAVRQAHERGVEVLICDHHLPDGSSVPDEATVLCPPQAGCTYPNHNLAACGVSLKLATALLADHPRAEALLRSMLKLAAIGTVADMVRLDNLENRAIVALGLQELNRGPHQLGLQALLQVCNLRLGQIRTSDLGFRVGPRINAAGRLADAGTVVRLLNSRNHDEAWRLAQDLEAYNNERRLIQKRLVSEALQQMGDTPDPFVLVSGSEDAGWHRGVVGIVAARLKDEVHHPVAVVSLQGEHAVGSIRSIPGVHAVEALNSAADLLVKFGGHPAAAGFTVPVHHLDSLHRRLCDWVTAHTCAEDFVRVHTYDTEASPEQLNQRTHSELAALGPFGMGNPRPRLVVKGVQLQDIELKGAEQRMVRCQIPRPRGGSLDAIWWDQAKHVRAMRAGAVDILGSLDENTFRGTRRLQFRLQDVREAATPP